ncbi:MAG: HamA C-terminal domain-containing protein [Jatrophihabitans sp.]|uniref:HamA C-terminal domain-containing protein n=1 Tax=Jatrophihabitans sp. TaxID=1932789 RepID=UPI003F7E388E
MPVPVLQVRVSWVDPAPPLTSLCPGYEQTLWRDEALVRDVFDRHLASFALPYSDVSTFTDSNAAAQLRKAAKAIYNTDKFQKRGEFGELFLHSVCRDLFRSEPAISKITFKDSPNDTVKGFDSVHVVEIDGELELWLGEVKLYQNLGQAIRDVTAELAEHLSSDYLRREFVAVVNKLDPAWPHAQQIARLLDENTSLDEVFDALTVPILLTYDSEAVSANSQVCAQYTEALTAEARVGWEDFVKRCDPGWPARLRLILLPLKSKVRLVDLMHNRLQAWQQL